MACSAIRPRFFGACPKKRCRAAKEKRFEASTSPWWARPPLPFGVSPNGTDWCVKLVCTRWVNWPGKVSLTQSAVMLGLRVRGRGGRDPTAPVAAPISAFLWGSTPFLCARAKKWGGTGSRGKRLLPKKTAHPHKPTDTHQPPAKVGRETSRPPTGSAHANGGATEVKKGAFLWRLDTVSLGKHQRNGVEWQGRLTTTSQRNGAHAQPPDTHQPPAKVGRGTSRLPTGSAHANGGAAGVKSAFLWRLDTVSLGKHQRNGVEWQGRPTKTTQRIGAHVQRKK